MRILKIIQHISIDGVIQAGGDSDGGFNYGDWSAPYRSPEGLAMVLSEWGPFKSIESEFIKSVRTLKSGEGPMLIVAGSSTLTSALIENALVDELLLLVNPVLLGKGKRIFAEGSAAQSFSLESSRTSKTGIVINKYKFMGEFGS